MTDENTLEKIKTFIEDKCGIDRIKIKSESRIEEDLKITGTDAVEFIFEFGKQFDINVSNFIIADYFEPGGLNKINWFFSKKASKRTLTVAHLEKAVALGQLDEMIFKSAEHEIFDELVVLITNKMGRYRFPLTRDTALERDLGITGDDAAELLMKFHETFKVDFTNFNINQYFYPEGDAMLPGLIRSIIRKPNPKQKELTIGDLEKAVRAGKLV